MYRAFDQLMTGAVRHPGRAGAVMRWTALVVVGTLFVAAIAAGSVVGSALLGALTLVAILLAVRGTYVAARLRHLDDRDGRQT